MVLQTKSAVVFLLICSIVTISCSSNKKNIPLVSVDVQAMPMIHSENVSSLVFSDSGITRYRLEAGIWDVYSNGDAPYWYFPEMISVEWFDSLFRVEGSIVADTAYYFEKKGLWQAIGNVVVKNTEGRTFETSELFWDEKAPPNVVNAFYTNQPVKIVEPDSTKIYGRNGFAADQSLSMYRLFNMKGEFIVEESTGALQQNTMRSDSIQLVNE